MKKLTFTIKVTKKDILKGIQQDCYKCPVARAVMRDFKAEEVEVDDFEIKVTVSRGEISFRRLPKCVKNFIEKFDDIDWEKRNKLKPFSFKLSI